MLSVRLPTIEQSALIGTSSCLLPSLHDGLTASIWTDVVPEEWCLGLSIVSLFVNQTRPIGVDLAVHSNGLVLSEVVSVGQKSLNSFRTHSHGTIQSLMLWIVGIKAQRSHKLLFGHSGTDRCDSRHVGKDVRSKKKSKPELYVH